MEFKDGLKDNMILFITNFDRNGKLVKEINDTFIALIPKVESPQRLSDFRPISLVGCLYKEEQSTFIQGSQILDGILIANELVDEARKLKKELIVFKVNFEKNFDSVD
jgi:hypothetical protein